MNTTTTAKEDYGNNEYDIDAAAAAVFTDDDNDNLSFEIIFIISQTSKHDSCSCEVTFKPISDYIKSKDYFNVKNINRFKYHRYH